MFRGQQVTAIGVGARNPAFDITPASLVTGIVTDVGIIRPPLTPGIKNALHNGR